MSNLTRIATASAIACFVFVQIYKWDIMLWLGSKYQHTLLPIEYIDTALGNAYLNVMKPS